MLHVILCEISGYILIGLIFFFFFKLQCFVAKAAAELTEEKRSITTVTDNFCQGTISYFLVPLHSLEPIFSSFLMHDNLPSAL